MRLQKLLAHAGVASRRAAERLITEGRVSVNGDTVTQLGSKADPLHDEVRVDGRRVQVSAHRRYLLLNKPAGFVTTRSDPQRRPTILSLLGNHAEYLYPVGRLDFESEGLMIVTNDGELAELLTHPRHAVVKVYRAVVRGLPDARAIERLRSGVRIEGALTAPAEVRLKRTSAAAGDRGRAILEIGIREGRNRQVRRMCEAVGHPVERLTRIRIGPLADRDLKPGTWRELTPREIEQLRSAAAASTPRPAGVRGREARAARKRGLPSAAASGARPGPARRLNARGRHPRT